MTPRPDVARRRLLRVRIRSPAAATSADLRFPRQGRAAHKLGLDCPSPRAASADSLLKGHHRSWEEGSVSEGDPSFIPKTYIKNTQGVVTGTCNPSTREGRPADPRASLATLVGLLGKIQANERPSQTKVDGTQGTTAAVALGLHTCLHTCATVHAWGQGADHEHIQCPKEQSCLRPTAGLFPGLFIPVTLNSTVTLGTSGCSTLRAEGKHCHLRAQHPAKCQSGSPGEQPTLSVSQLVLNQQTEVQHLSSELFLANTAHI